MELSPDGQKLTLRGYIGIPLFGKSQVWNSNQIGGVDHIPKAVGRPARILR